MNVLSREVSKDRVRYQEQRTIRGLPEGYHSRPARLDDVKDALRMLNANARHLVGVEKFQEPELEIEWKEPGFNLDSDTRLVIAPDGLVVAYYEVWDPQGPHTHIHCWGRVHPGHTGLGIGAHLLEWAEQRARLAIPKAPQEARVALEGYVISIDEAAQELFRLAGFALIRQSLRMVIELNGKPDAPQWPEGIRVRGFIPGQDDFPLFKAVHEAFRDHWGYLERSEEEEYARWLHRIENDEDFDPSLWFLAVDGDEIAGMSLCRPRFENDPEMGWVSTLGVRRPWRRRGLGFALLRHSFQELHRRGKRRVGLGVDAQSLTGATRLYLKAGMHPDPTRQHNLYEKELRPGIELSTQSVEMVA